METFIVAAAAVLSLGVVEPGRRVRLAHQVVVNRHGQVIRGPCYPDTAPGTGKRTASGSQRNDTTPDAEGARRAGPLRLYGAHRSETQAIRADAGVGQCPIGMKQSTAFCGLVGFPPQNTLCESRGRL